MATVYPKPGPNDEPLFEESHKEQVLFTLDSYEKATNSEIQKTLDAISKKKEDLEALQAGLLAIRKAKEIVKAEFPDTMDDLVRSQRKAPGPSPDAK